MSPDPAGRHELICLGDADVVLARCGTMRVAGAARPMTPSRVDEALDRVERGLRKLPLSARVRVARKQVHELRKLSREIEALHCEPASGSIAET